ncbi:MAG: hypothetical protein A3J79_07630 [Elusimicrobia bacterium RIFOXYB2_FULL_62_6]|nr:MAG: hypothetical protein A3J79_07630 [Elusimicrobia bacterium RIFOXYB2_FULL_62_6]
MKRIILTAVLTFIAAGAQASGFRLSEQDAAANGMGNSFVAVADNASAVWYNPAAMTALEGTNMSLGTVMVYPGMKHEFTGGSDSIAKKLHVPPYLYITRKMGPGWALGLGFNAPFGLSTEWADSSQTKLTATYSDIKGFNYNLNAAFKLGERLSFALGADYVQLTAELSKMYTAPYSVSPLTYQTVTQTLDGDGTGTGWNAAAFYRHSDRLSFGASYRSPVKVKMDGKITMPLAGVAAGSALNDDASTEVTLPDTFQAGAAIKAGEKWLFSATADFTDWATYHKLVIDYKNTSSTDHKHWKSVWAFRFGGEYKSSDKLKLRAGVFYDYNPVKDSYFETRVPDSNRTALSLGAGYAVSESLTVDLSYTYLRFSEREIDSATNTLDGKYTSYAHLPALSFGYKF